MTQIETLPNIGHEIEKEFGFKPDFERPKVYLEENNATRNKSKAATLPVFTSTTVMGALTMLLSMRLLLNLKIDLADPQVLMGFFIGGAVTYWLNGASLKAAMSGTIRSIDHIKNTFKEDEKTPRKSIENSMRAVKVFAQFARLSTINIYGAAYFLTLAFAFWSPTFFASYSISVILFGFYQGVFIAKTVGATGNNTETLTANPFMKFTILFGFLATEISVKLSSRGEFTEMTSVAAGIMATTGLVFIWRSMDALKKT